MTQPLKFQAAVTAVKQSVSAYSSGSVALTLTVQEPRRPFAVNPGVPIYKSGAWLPRPVPPARKKNEADDAYQKRAEPLKQSQAGYDAAMSRYRQEVEKYEREFAEYRRAIEDYMWLVGSAGIIGATAVTVTLEPLNRGFAEMEPLLLPPPVDVTPAEVEPPDAGDVGIDAAGVNCEECGHPRAFHDDEPPPGCAEVDDEGVPCDCNRGTAA